MTAAAARGRCGVLERTHARGRATGRFTPRSTIRLEIVSVDSGRWSTGHDRHRQRRPPCARAFRTI